MGDTKNLTAVGSPMKPHHRVTLTYDFYMQRLEVTNSDYLDFLNENPVSPDGWMNGHRLINMGNEYCEFVHVGGAFRLANTGKANYPVHAEWEYAARGAENDYLTPNDFLFAGGNTLDSFGWYRLNCLEPDYPIFLGGGTHVGGGKNPNEIGLFDMSGNVEEWCHDWYSQSYYSVSPAQNPTGPVTGTKRVARGGSWYSFADQCIVFVRNNFEPSDMEPFIGFRMAKTK